MSYDLRTLDSVYWQPQLQEFGDIARGIDDINQCILTILWTQKGSDHHRPDFGIDIMAYMDKPIAWVRPKLVAEILKQVAAYEARAIITKVQVRSDVGKLTISLAWYPSWNANSEMVYLTTTSVAASSGVTMVDSPFVSIPFVYTLEGPIDGGTV